MAFKKLKFRIIGEIPLIMHSGQLADPLNGFAKEMKKFSSKKSKTEADYEQLAKLEFLGSLYLDESGPIIPAECLEAALVEGAKKVKKGPRAKAGVYCEHAKLDYKGPRKPDALWAETKFRYTCGVRVNKARVMRTRPIFNEWSAVITVKFDDQMLDPGDIEVFVAKAGAEVGLLERRPRFGRFSYEKVA